MDLDSTKFNFILNIIPKYIEEEKFLQCSSCNLKSGDMEELFQHYEDYHFEEIELQCKYCVGLISTFESLMVLKDHYQKHSSRDIYTCVGCNTFGSCKKLLINHMVQGHETEDVLILHTERRSDNQNNYKYMISLCEGRKTLSTSVKCFFCDNSFTESLEEHLINYHFFKIEYSCQKCENVVRNSPDDVKQAASMVRWCIS